MVLISRTDHRFVPPAAPGRKGVGFTLKWRLVNSVMNSGDPFSFPLVFPWVRSSVRVTAGFLRKTAMGSRVVFIARRNAVGFFL